MHQQYILNSSFRNFADSTEHYSNNIVLLYPYLWVQFQRSMKVHPLKHQTTISQPSPTRQPTFQQYGNVCLLMKKQGLN
jgi:hypothetical protein